jgi:hypothetical protein
MTETAPELSNLLDAIRTRPNDRFRWLALAAWFWGNSRDDEVAAIRVYWSTLAGYVTAGNSLHMALREVARNATLLGQWARDAEDRDVETFAWR